MTGAAPRPIGFAPEEVRPRQRPVWRPETKVGGQFLTPFLHGAQNVGEETEKVEGGGLIEEVLPDPSATETETFDAQW